MNNIQRTLLIVLSLIPTTAFAQDPAPGGGGLGGLMLPIIAMIAIMYFIMIRPQQKRDRERRNLLDNLSKGDQVVTTGGICGTIVGITDERVVVRVDDNVKLEFLRTSIAFVDNGDQDSK